MSEIAWTHRDDELLEFRRAGGQVVRGDKDTFAPSFPAVLLIDPKYPHNVGQAVRLASCYGAQHVLMVGSRVPLHDSDSYRLPREERMRGYGEVTIIRCQRPFDLYPRGVEFVAVEVRENAESLVEFQHPENAVYVFGPEDGSLGRPTLGCCTRFVQIPTRHCLNLATAVGTVLYDRFAKHSASTAPTIDTGE